ncbi:MAG: sigma-70 family RNA polymerase sigma factor [Haliscomenobacteraceae bacterium CHB4]|nr:hypothetical protein [Saprospiraceae bacterium]MCE7926630.1 sigma-70 family RNA polymerase sigma factor [Haliscomenobacteraceae bacterium CHB4]
MARILDIFLNRGGNKHCHAYPDPKSLFDGLEREAPGAIRCLSAKIAGSVYKTGRLYQLVDDDIEELMCDCITLMIEKIRAGQYAFQGYDPATFAIEIAKNKVRNFRRNADRNATGELTPAHELAEDDEIHLSSLEQTELLETLLQKISDNCRNLIRLRYLEEIKDKDAIARQLTQYSTVDALKNHRAMCMKKLVELAQQRSVKH